MRCYPHFILPMRRSRGFASTATNLVALFRLAFASAPLHSSLTWLMTVSRRIIMQKAHRHTGIAPMVLRSLVGMWFQVHYPPLVGVLPIFRSRYYTLSVASEYLALRDGPRGFKPRFTCTVLLRCRTLPFACRVRDYHPLWPPIPERSARLLRDCCPVLQPHPDESRWFRLIRVRSPLLTESRFLSFPRGNEMFQFPPFARHTYGFSVAQFGNPGINTCLTVSPGLSQSSTPFIACWRLDIPHMPLVAWPH